MLYHNIKISESTRIIAAQNASALFRGPLMSLHKRRWTAEPSPSCVPRIEARATAEACFGRPARRPVT